MLAPQTKLLPSQNDVHAMRLRGHTTTSGTFDQNSMLIVDTQQLVRVRYWRLACIGFIRLDLAALFAGIRSAVEVEALCGVLHQILVG